MQDPIIDVTLFAVQLKMHTFQEEIAMEVTRAAPAAFIMTFRTERSIRSVMHIPVTGLTIFGFKFWKIVVTLSIIGLLFKASRGRLMTLSTFNLLMLALQLVVRFAMIEFLALLKRIRDVTGGAGLSGKFFIEHVLMFIDMTFFTEASIDSFECIHAPFPGRFHR